jgi:hypothetical protein
MSAPRKSQLSAARKSAPKAMRLERPAAELVRLLGAGEPAMLVLHADAALRLVQHCLIPPTLRVERGQEAALLASSVAAAARSGWPLIVLFEGGMAPVTHYAGVDLIEGRDP